MRHISSISVLALIAAASVFQQKAVAAPEGPVDIYEAAGTPCVAAYSTVRVLSSKYTGPLYQVRRTSDKQTKDIPQLTDGFADSKVQDDFLGTGAGTISKLYDQSGKGNNLTAGKKGCLEGTASQDNKESDAKGRSLTVAGHKVYSVFTKPTEGYRSNQEGYSGYPARAAAAAGMPTGNKPQGVYAVLDGKRPGMACCFNFGNASTNNCYGPTGQMNTLFFGGVNWWGEGAGSGPWFMNDMEAGVWAGGTANPPGTNPQNPSITWEYAFGISKTSTESNKAKYCLRVGNAQSGNLTTAWDGDAPSTWKTEGSIVLGVGGDNSNSSYGTFFEGCITAGRPSDATDALVLKNVQAQNYGKETPVSTISSRSVSSANPLKVTFNQATGNAVIRYSLQNTQNVSLKIFNQQGKQIAKVIDGVVTAGQHEVSWNANLAPSGVYVAKVALDGRSSWTGTIITKN
jgi:hypothetical protein